MRRRQFTFGLPPDLVASSPGVEKLNLPLEVHDRRTFKLVGRGTLQGGVKLAPGRSYLVTAALPDGSRISAQAKAAPGTGRIQLIQPKPSSPLKARDKGRPADVTRATAALAESMTATSVEAYDADGTATQHPAGASTSLESVAIRPVEKPDRSALDFGKVAATVTGIRRNPPRGRTSRRG